MTDSPSDPAAVDRLFDELCDLPAGERTAFLQGNVQDSAVRQQLRRLLTHFDEETRAFGILPGLETSGALPERIGPYRVQSLLGTGGMGVVYLARRGGEDAPVALKVLRHSLGSTHLRNRFRREAAVLRRLDHPGICRFLDAGEDDTPGASLPYLAMEYLAGEPLLEHARKHGLDDRQRVELMARICDAVHHAHELGVVHRDLKPSNVLVLPEEDAERVGRPKVLDFGVARAVGEDFATLTMTETGTGALVGTVAYMSPEQVAGKTDAVDERSDVYSLGVILFELLAHRLPYAITGLPVPVIARVIQEEEPSRLGSAIERLRGPLENVAAKALEKEKRRRYPSAAELAADLRRFLLGQPVQAKPPTLIHQALKFARRHRALTATVAGTMLALSIGLVTTIWFALGEVRARQISDRRLYRAQLEATAMAIARGDAKTAEGELESAKEELRGWEWHHLRGRVDDARLVLDVQLAKNSDTELAFDGHGRLAMVTTKEGVQYVVWDLDSGREITNRSLPGWGALSPDGASVLLVDDDGRLALYALPSGDRLASLALPVEAAGPIYDATYDGTLALVACAQAAYLVDPRAGSVRKRSRLPAWSAHVRTNRRTGWGTVPIDSGGVMLFTLDDSSKPSTLPGGLHGAYPAALSPDGTRVAHPSSEGFVSQWLLSPDGPPELDLRIGAPREQAWVAAYSADGALLATGGEDRATHVTAADTGQRLRTFGGHREVITALAFSSDSRWLASASKSAVRVFDLALEDPRVFRVGAYVYAAAFDPSGELLLVGSTAGDLLLCDARSLVEFARIRLWKQDSIVTDLAFDPHRDRVAACANDGHLVVLDLESGGVVADLMTRRGPSASFSPDGARLVAVCAEGSTEAADVHDVFVWNAESYELLRSFALDTDKACIRHDPQGRWIATTHPDASAVLFDPTSFEPVARLEGARVQSLAFSPDGARLATAAFDQTCRIWDLDRMEEVTALVGHDREVYGVAWSPDGTRVLTGSNDQSIRVWSAEHGDEIAKIPGHRDYVFSVAVHPAGEAVVSASGDGTAQVWDTRTREEAIAEQRLYRETVERLAPRIDRLVALPVDTVAAELAADASLSDRERLILRQQLLGRRVE